MLPPGVPWSPSLIRCPFNLTLNLRTLFISLILKFLIFFKILHWSIVDFQCFVSSRCKRSHSLFGYVYLKLGICEGRSISEPQFSHLKKWEDNRTYLKVCYRDGPHPTAQDSAVSEGEPIGVWESGEAVLETVRFGFAQLTTVPWLKQSPACHLQTVCPLTLLGLPLLKLNTVVNSLHLTVLLGRMWN